MGVLDDLLARLDAGDFVRAQGRGAGSSIPPADLAAAIARLQPAAGDFVRAQGRGRGFGLPAVDPAQALPMQPRQPELSSMAGMLNAAGDYGGGPIVVPPPATAPTRPMPPVQQTGADAYPPADPANDAVVSGTGAAPTLPQAPPSVTWMPPKGITTAGGGTAPAIDPMGNPASVFPDVPPAAKPWARDAGMLTAPGIGSLASGAQEVRADAAAGTPTMPAEVPMPRPRPADTAQTDSSPREANGDVRDARADAGDEEGPAASTGHQAFPSAGGGSGGGFDVAPMFGRIGNFLRDNSSTLLALGAGFAGAPNVGQGISRAAAAALPATQADYKRQLQTTQLSTSYQALVDAGVPKNLALAAVSNPEIMKRVSDTYVTDRKGEVKTLKDALGNESLVVVNPYTGEQMVPGGSNTGPAATASGAPASGAATGLGALSQIPPNYDPVTQRDEGFMDALRHVDPSVAQTVKDIADGKGAGTGRNMQKFMPLVHRYEQGFEDSTFRTRANLQNSYFGGGEGFKAIRSANTVIHHGAELDKAINDLHNFATLPGFLNPITGGIAEQYSKPYQDALKRFDVNAEAFAKELDFALTGKSTVSGQQHIREMFDRYASPVANHAALQKAMELLRDRIDEHETAYRKGMSMHSTEQPFTDFLTNRPQLEKLLNEDSGAGRSANGPVRRAVAPGAAPGAMAPGHYRYDPATGNTVRVQ